MLVPLSQSPIVPEEKIRKYLLCVDHPEGGPKAAFFSRFGFSQENWKKFENALRRHIQDNEVADVVEGRFGTSYVVEGPILGIDGRAPEIRSVWMISAESPNPRLVTAYPM